MNKRNILEAAVMQRGLLSFPKNSQEYAAYPLISPLISCPLEFNFHDINCENNWVERKRKRGWSVYTDVTGTCMRTIYFKFYSILYFTVFHFFFKNYYFFLFIHLFIHLTAFLFIYLFVFFSFPILQFSYFTIFSTTFSTSGFCTPIFVESSTGAVQTGEPFDLKCHRQRKSMKTENWYVRT